MNSQYVHTNSKFLHEVDFVVETGENNDLKDI